MWFPPKKSKFTGYWSTHLLIPSFDNLMKYQPSGAGGTRSPPATPHSLQNPKWPPVGPKMANGVWKGVYPWVFGRSKQLSLFEKVATEKQME